MNNFNLFFSWKANPLARMFPVILPNYDKIISSYDSVEVDFGEILFIEEDYKSSPSDKNLCEKIKFFY